MTAEKQKQKHIPNPLTYNKMVTVSDSAER